MSEPNYNEIRARIQGRFNKRKELLMHLTAFLGVNIVVWALWLTDTLPIREILGIPLPILVSLAWGAGLFIHYLDYYFEAGGGVERRERDIQQAIARAVALRGGESPDEKPKRDRHLHLTEDGELETLADDDAETSQSRRYR